MSGHTITDFSDGKIMASQFFVLLDMWQEEQKETERRMKKPRGK
jgi:hypothetical protein